MVKCRESVKNLSPYIPGEPIERVMEKFGLSEVIKLASNENPYGASREAAKAFAESFETPFLYPDGACGRLRDALSGLLCVDKRELVFGCGADELISIICQTFIEETDEIITGEISFMPYETCARATGGRVVRVKMKNLAYDLDAMARAVSEKTKLIFLANPNNPTGTLFTDKEKIDFLDKIPKHVLVVFDEAYEEFVEDKSYNSSVPLVEKYDNLVILKTFSKIYGLAALRVGYAVANERYAACMEKIRKPFNVSTSAQAAALAALRDQEHTLQGHEKNLTVKRYCYGELDAMGLDYVKTQANFIFINIGGADSVSVFERLKEKGFIIRPGAQFGADGYVRVSFGTMWQMEQFFVAFKEVLGTCSTWNI